MDWKNNICLINSLDNGTVTPYYWICKMTPIVGNLIQFEIIESHDHRIGDIWTESEYSLKSIHENYLCDYCSTLEEAREIIFLNWL